MMAWGDGEDTPQADPSDHEGPTDPHPDDDAPLSPPPERAVQELEATRREIFAARDRLFIALGRCQRLPLTERAIMGAAVRRAVESTIVAERQLTQGLEKYRSRIEDPPDAMIGDRSPGDTV